MSEARELPRTTGMLVRVRWPGLVMRRSIGVLAASSALLAGGACDALVDPQVVVVLAAGPASASRATFLRLSVVDHDGVEVERRVVSLGPAGEVILPARVPITARGGDSARRFELVAELFDGGPPPLEGGTPFNLLRVRSGFSPGRVVELRVELTDACIGRSECGPGRTCFHGVCRGACFEPIEDELGAPVCSECETCSGSGLCAPLPLGTACGCPGESCQAGRCETTHPITLVTGGRDHSCALPGERDLHCWGGGSRGQLGVAGTTGETSPILVGAGYRTVDAGGRQPSAAHTCAILERTAELYCWGANDEGQLGLGVLGDRSTPARAVTSVELQEVSAGGEHTCALTRTGEIHCWGRNVYGQLGAGRSEASLSLPTRVAADVMFEDVCAGDSHSCAIATDGSVHCWGQNDDGQLGLGADRAAKSTPVRVAALAQATHRSIACGNFHTCALATTGVISCWGGNQFGNLGRGGGLADDADPAPIDSTLAFAALACGGSHCCAIAEGSARLYCWGGNREGAVGDGTTLDARATPIWVAPGTRWTDVGPGHRHTCAVQDGGALYCWGDNAAGQLGVGDAAPRLVPARVCLP